MDIFALITFIVGAKGFGLGLLARVRRGNNRRFGGEFAKRFILFN